MRVQVTREDRQSALGYRENTPTPKQTPLRRRSASCW